MKTHLRRASLWLLVLIGACSSNDNSAPPALTVTAAITSGAVPTVSNGVKADGNNLVRIDVSGATLGPIHVTTSRGIFPGGQRTVTINDTSGFVNLIVCDARADRNCAGAAFIGASDAKGALGSASVTLVGFETTCNNLNDDNKDTRIDCADPDCEQLPCVDVSAHVGVCSAGACIPPVCTPRNPTEICDNGVDDDCDLLSDCEQASCDGQPCKPGSPSFACQGRACTDVLTGYAMTVTPARARLPANGAATTTLKVTVTHQGAGQSGLVIDLTTDLGSFVTATGRSATTSATTGASGQATVTFAASDTAGMATITATAHSLPQLNARTFVEMPALGSIVLGSTQSGLMGVKFSGFNEQNLISALILDTEQRPYPDGLEVRFEHQQLGGSVISAPWTADTAGCVRSAGCLGYLTQTGSPPSTPDSQGRATVTLSSGTAAGPVSVTVTATAGGVTRSFTIQNVAIVGAKVSGLHVSLSCTPQNVAGYWKHDCINSFWVGGPVECTVFLADRFNNVLGVPVRADFRSEAGSPGPPVVTVGYDPVAGGDQTSKLGHATNSVSVTGYRLPLDVTPASDEKSLSYTSACGQRTHNPRDGLSTVIAAVQGEEGFVDLNGNGVYDRGEPFADAGEPFVDENDNGVQDQDERFIDVNQNGIWDGPNGIWDADTVVWAETRVLYTSGLAEPVARWLAVEDKPLLPGVTPPVTFTVQSGGGKAQFAIFAADLNLNPLVPLPTTAWKLTSSAGNVKAAFVSPLPAPVESIGMTVAQLYCDQPPPATGMTCSSNCTTAPCYRLVRISDYRYGTSLTAEIEGALPGDDVMTASADLGTLRSTTSIRGTSE